MTTIAYDASAFGSQIINDVPGSTQPLIFSVTVGTNTNRLLVVGIDHVDFVGNAVMDGSSYIVSCTYNNISMQFIGSVQIGSAIIDVYYLINPDSGSHNVRIEFDDQITPGANLLVTAAAGAISFYNCNQSTAVISQSGYSTGVNSPISKSLTTTSSENMLVDITVSVLSTTITPSSGQTARVNQQVGTLGAIFRQGMSHRQSTGGTDTMLWTEGTSTRDWATFVIELKAAQADIVKKLAISHAFFRKIHDN